MVQPTNECLGRSYPPRHRSVVSITIRDVADSFRDKLSRLTESNLFWSGGVAMALAAITLAPTRQVFSLVCLVIAWLILTVSIYKHRFFERRTKWEQALYNSLASVFVAGLLVLVWAASLPEAMTPSNPDEVACPSWLHQQASAGWYYFKSGLRWLYPYVTGFIIALLLINAKRFLPSSMFVRTRALWR